MFKHNLFKNDFTSIPAIDLFKHEHKSKFLSNEVYFEVFEENNFFFFKKFRKSTKLYKGDVIYFEQSYNLIVGDKEEIKNFDLLDNDHYRLVFCIFFKKTNLDIFSITKNNFNKNISLF